MYIYIYYVYNGPNNDVGGFLFLLLADNLNAEGKIQYKVFQRNVI